MYDQDGEEGAELRAARAWRKKESERKNRKNATGRKYVVEIARCRREVGDRSLLERRPLFGSVLPLRAGNIEEREGWSGKREGSAISYILRVFPHIFHMERAARDHKNLPKSVDRNRILFNDLQLPEGSETSSFSETRTIFT